MEGVWPRTVRAGSADQRISAMTESTGLYRSGDHSRLRARLAADGYLFLRGVVPREHILAARRHVLAYLSAAGALDATRPVSNGAHRRGQTEVGLMSRQDVAASAPVRRALESAELHKLLSVLLGGGGEAEAEAEVVVRPFQFKWLRAVAEGEYTGVHVDRVYLGDSTSATQLLTSWMPLGAVAAEQGSLLVCEGSHSASAGRGQFAELQRTYGAGSSGASSSDGTVSGWLGDAPSEAARKHSFVPACADSLWRGADFLEGDVCIVHPRLLHMSAANTTRRLRLSCDCRWAVDGAEVDPRFRLGEPLAVRRSKRRRSERDGR